MAADSSRDEPGGEPYVIYVRDDEAKKCLKDSLKGIEHEVVARIGDEIEGLKKSTCTWVQEAVQATSTEESNRIAARVEGAVQHWLNVNNAEIKKGIFRQAYDLTTDYIKQLVGVGRFVPMTLNFNTEFFKDLTFNIYATLNIVFKFAALSLGTVVLVDLVFNYPPKLIEPAREVMVILTEHMVAAIKEDKELMGLLNAREELRKEHKDISNSVERAGKRIMAETAELKRQASETMNHIAAVKTDTETIDGTTKEILSRVNSIATGTDAINRTTRATLDGVNAVRTDARTTDRTVSNTHAIITRIESNTDAIRAKTEQMARFHYGDDTSMTAVVERLGPLANCFADGVGRVGTNCPALAKLFGGQVSATPAQVDRLVEAMRFRPALFVPGAERLSNIEQALYKVRALSEYFVVTKNPRMAGFSINRKVVRLNGVETEVGCVRMDNVAFHTGETKPEPVSAEYIGKLGAILHSTNQAKSFRSDGANEDDHGKVLHLQIVGHADQVPYNRSALGRDNCWLSHQRAIETKDLLEQGGLSDVDVRVTGYGNRRLVSPGGNRTNRARSRRVEVFLSPRRAAIDEVVKQDSCFEPTIPAAGDQGPCPDQ